MCTLMPHELHHVADEVLTLDLDFDADLSFGDVIHRDIFRIRSQKRFLPDLGASFGIKFVQLIGCKTRVWWSFSEQKLMLGFRQQPTVRWDIAARMLGVELPSWLEDKVLCMGLARLLSKYSLKNPFMFQLDGQEQLDREDREERVFR